MKVSTDSLILGSYVPVDGVCRALDLGTGSGLLALMMAQRQALMHIDAIDSDVDAVHQAGENIAACPWPQRIKTYHGDVTTWQEPQGYDLILCNPPYFPDHMASATVARQVARQGQKAVSDWLQCVHRNMAQHGRFYWIVPASQQAQRAAVAEASGLYLCDELVIFSTTRKAARLVIQGWQLQECERPRQQRLVIHSSDGYSDEFRKLTGEFYLAGTS